MLVALECIWWLNSIGRYSWRHTMCKGQTAGVCTGSLRPQKKIKKRYRMLHGTSRSGSLKTFVGGDAALLLYHVDVPHRTCLPFLRKWCIYYPPRCRQRFTAASVTPAPTEKAGDRARDILQRYLCILMPRAKVPQQFFFFRMSLCCRTRVQPVNE